VSNSDAASSGDWASAWSAVATIAADWAPGTPIVLQAGKDIRCDDDAVADVYASTHADTQAGADSYTGFSPAASQKCCGVAHVFCSR
jgi:hypothetical protein